MRTKQQIKEYEKNYYLKNRTKKLQQMKEYNKIYYLKNKKKLTKRIKENFNKKSVEEKREIYKKKSPYQKVYFYNRYHSDPIFRQKHLDRVNKYNKRVRK